MAMYEALRARFGRQGWWPASAELDARGRALEICVGAILTQNTAWSNVERALADLIARPCPRRRPGPDGEFDTRPGTSINPLALISNN